MAVNWHEHNEAIGFWAGSLTTASFLPQLINTWRTNGHGLTWTMLALFSSGIGLWLVYGVIEHSLPVILANALTFAQLIIITGIKLFKRGPRA